METINNFAELFELINKETYHISNLILNFKLTDYVIGEYRTKYGDFKYTLYEDGGQTIYVLLPIDDDELDGYYMATEKEVETMGEDWFIEDNYTEIQ